MASNTAKAQSQRMLSTHHVAERFGVSTRSIQLWSRSGLLPAWKTPGGHRRFLIADVEKLERRLAVPAQGKQSETSPLLFLISDDEVEIGRVLSAGENAPMQVLASANGYGGLIEIGIWNPAVVVVDLDATSFDPFAMLEAICGHPLTTGTRVIAASRAHSSEDALPRGLPTGAHFTTLPLDIEGICSGQGEWSGRQRLA